MTQEQGWDEANEHHDPFDFEDAGYPHALEEAARRLTDAMTDAGYSAGSLLPETVTTYTFEGERAVWPPNVAMTTQGVSAQMDGGVSGAIMALSDNTTEVFTDGSETQTLREMHLPQEWKPIGSVGELQAEYALLGDLFDRGMKALTEGNTPLSPREWAMGQMEQLLRISQRMHFLHAKITGATLGYRDARHIVVFAEPGKFTADRATWLFMNVPDWTARVNVADHVDLLTHYSSGFDDRTLCEQDRMPSVKDPHAEPGTANCPACVQKWKAYTEDVD